MPQTKIDLSAPHRQSFVGVSVMFFRNLRNSINLVIFLFLPFYLSLKGNDDLRIAIWILAGIILSFILVLSYLQYKRFFFYVKDDKFVIERGVFSKKRVTVPFERIQSVNLRQNLIQQILQVYGLEVETAGSKKNEVEIPALTRNYAQTLKDYLLVQRNIARKAQGTPTDTETEIAESSSSETQAPPKEERRMLLHVDVPTLIKVGLTENHLRTGFVTVAVIFGYIQQFQDIVTYIEEHVEEYAGTLATLGLISVILGGVLFLFISILLSLIQTVLRFFNLKMWLSDDGLTVESGLLKRVENYVPVSKIQFIRWHSNPLRKLIRIKSLSIFQAASEAINRKRSVQVPACREALVETVERAFFPEKEENPWVTMKPNAFMLRRLFLFFVLLPGLAFTALWYVADFPILPLIPVYLFLSGWFSYKYFISIRYTVGRDMLIIKKGFVFPKILLVKLYKIQSVARRQSIFQKRRGLISLTLYTAAGTLSVPFVDENWGHAYADRLLSIIETNKKPWM